MTKKEEKKVMLLQEYKEGFSEIQKLVESFDAIQPDSQETFINERQEVLKSQLKFVNEQRYEVFLEARGFLARINSKLKTLLDTERFIISQINECEEFIKIITTEEKKVSDELDERMDAHV